MKLRPKFEYEAYRYTKKNERLDELKRWLIDRKIEVLKFEVWKDDDGDCWYLEIYYKNENCEVNCAELKDGWYIYVDEYNIINTMSEEYKNENYEEV